MFPVYKTGVTLNELPDCIAYYIQFHSCTIRCGGCHSSFLWNNTGSYLDYDTLIVQAIDNRDYGCDSIILFGDINNGISIREFSSLCSGLSSILPLCVYSGADSVIKSLGDEDTLKYLSYIKLGHFDNSLGGLSSQQTNQRLYTINAGKIDKDITYKFWRR